MQQLTPEQLRLWLDDASREHPVLVDVREPWEHEICRIPNSLLIPMGTIPSRQAELRQDAHTVIICHHGTRSLQTAMYLERCGFKYLYNLSGGIDAWARRVELAAAIY